MSSTQEQLTQLLDTAKEQLSGCDYASAEQSFEELIVQAPLFPTVYINCATAQYFQKKNGKALVNLDIAAALLPQGAELASAYHNRSLVHTELNNISEAIIDLKAAKALGFEPSETELEKVIKRQSEEDIDAPESLAAKIQALYGQARNEFSTNPLHALALFTKVIDLDPKSIDAAYGVGLANSALGRLDQALESFDDVMADSRPEYSGLRAETLYNRSAIFKEKDEINQAVIDLEECIKLSLDTEVKFPVLGSAEKEKAMIESMQRELEEWKAQRVVH